MESSGMANDGPARRALMTAVVYARNAPGRVLAAILAVHFVLWTVIPILVCPNLQLDLVDDLALGREWQLGYWKHPPLPWWLAEVLHRLTGSIDSVYVLGPLAAVLCLYGVYLLARDIVGPLQALLAVLALEGIHFYNFSVVKFAHDQAQLPFWAFTALFFHRAITRQRLLEWGVAGFFLAGAFWSKYAAVPLAATLGLILLLDPEARKSWRGAGPWLMAVVFLCVLAPNLWWLVEHDFLPFRYVDARAKLATHWYQYLIFPLQWTGGQLLFILPGLALIGLLYVGGRPAVPTPSGAADRAAFDRRYVTALALGPFAVTTLMATVLGRLPIAMWGYPLWSFAPLALLVWLGPVEQQRRLQRFALGFVVVFAAFPIAYAAIELFEPLLRDRPKATQFPGAATAAAITDGWQRRFNAAPAYVCGSEFEANNVAVYSPAHPHVVVHCDPELSPWIDVADVRRRGMIVMIDRGLVDHAMLDQWRATWGPFDTEPPLQLQRQTLRRLPPVEVFYGFVPPRP
jgi:hypothetical protein